MYLLKHFRLFTNIAVFIIYKYILHINVVDINLQFRLVWLMTAINPIIYIIRVMGWITFDITIVIAYVNL
jgi:hypothetical protein